MARARAPNVFGGGRHDRLEERREDAVFLAAALPRARVLLVAGEQVAVCEGAPPRALDLTASELAAFAPDLAAAPEPGRLWLLGEHEGSIYFGAEAPDAGGFAALAAARGATVAPLKTVAARLPAGEAALLAHLRGLAAWHASSRHCGTCGAPTVATHAGHQRRCTAGDCGAALFPRTDVAVIAIVSRGDRALLVRQPGWRPHHFATIAGFLEPGEGLEGGLAREVREEVGLELRSIRYHSSQPWPFPTSLMVGFRAEAAAGALRLSAEIAAARWMRRGELATALRAGEITIAAPVSISFRLIAAWYGDADELAALAGY